MPSDLSLALTVLTPHALVRIAPESHSCTTAEIPLDCRTADIVAPLIDHSFATYDITEPAAMAAIVAHMVAQSGEFRYKRNLAEPHVYGTANQQGPVYNVQYGLSIDAIRGEVEGLGIDTPQAATNDTLDRLLDLVTRDEYNFATGAWYYHTYCGDEVSEALARDPVEGYKVFINDCYGMDWDMMAGNGEQARHLAYFRRAVGVFALSERLKHNVLAVDVAALSSAATSSSATTTTTTGSKEDAEKINRQPPPSLPVQYGKNREDA